MFIGIDHGTTAMRFAGENGEFRISREAQRSFALLISPASARLMRSRGSPSATPWAIISAAITDIRKVKDRGIVSRDGAGKHIGGGTRVFDEVAASGIPAVVMPGLHRGSPTDPRFKAYSHQTSPEKIGIAYEVCDALGGDVIVSDVSSNTVSLLVSGGKLVGAFDACIFAPGTPARGA